VKRDKSRNEPKSYAELGRSEELGDEDAGDIADETSVHRG
jgi:hypothetical protein